MAIVDDRPQLETGAPLLTAADLAAMPSDLPSGPVYFELDNGRLVMMSPTGGPHGRAHSQIVGHLLVQGEWPGHGKVWIETGLILWRNPDRVVGPDVMFVCKGSVPVKLSPERYLETMADLVVEIRSKNDTVAYCNRKIKDYLHAGAKTVWFVEPQAETVTVHRGGADPQVLRAGDTITAEEIIPGFKLPVADMFRE